MGREKHEQSEHDRKFYYAVELCREFGAIEECEEHEGEYMDAMAYSDSNELAAMIAERNPGALAAFDSLEEMSEYVSEAMDSVGEVCGYCEKNDDS